MHILSALVSGAALVAAAPGMAARGLAPALPVDAFNTMDFMGSTLDQAKAKPKLAAPALVKGPKFNTFATGQCTNPRYRIEWDRLGDDQKQNWVNSIKCLMQRPPSGKYNIATNRYEDLVALHQIFTPNVHGNSKFLIWHRYFLWTFEDLLRKECGLTTAFPWFDETRYAGHFRDSSVFSSRWLGGVAYNGNCVTDGQFAGLTLNIGPGTSNQPHCLSRNGDGSKTANCNSDFVNECNSRDNYADMESCAEGGPHAWGHNGIGAVMGDVYGSPGDPTFWLHHAFVDRNYRIWQNQDSNRVRYVNGNDVNGNPLTLDMDVSVYGIRPNVKIGDILDTLGPTLCYRYDY